MLSRKERLRLATVKFAKIRFPVAGWLPRYSIQRFSSDLISALTCGVMIIPHSLALSSLALLPPQYGMYTAFLPGLVYGIFGTSRDLNLGPTALSSMLTAQYNPTGDPVLASLLAFLAGCVILVVGVFKLGFVTEFISTPVLSGFISAVVLTILVSQIKYMFGLSKAPRGIFNGLKHAALEIKNTNAWDAGMGICCLAALLILEYVGKIRVKAKPGGQLTRRQHTANKLLWLVGIARSAMVACVAGLISFCVHQQRQHSFTTTGKLPPGLPSFKSPFVDVVLSGNRTLTGLEPIRQLGTASVVCAVIIFLETIAIGKALSKSNGYRIDPSQEALALGIVNIAGSMVQAYPVAASFSRSAVNSLTKAASPLAGVMTSLIVLLALTVMTPAFQFVPIASLAAIIIASIIRMIEFDMPRRLWKVNRLELIPFFAAFFGSLYELEVGILLGSACSICLILRRALKPHSYARVDKENGVAYFHFKGGVWFSGINSMANEIREIVDSYHHCHVLERIVIDCEELFDVDYTSAYGLRTVITELKAKNIEVEVINLNEQNVRELLVRAGLKKTLDSMEKESSECGDLRHTPLLRYQTEV